LPSVSAQIRRRIRTIVSHGAHSIASSTRRLNRTRANTLRRRCLRLAGCYKRDYLGGCANILHVSISLQTFDFRYSSLRKQRIERRTSSLNKRPKKERSCKDCKLLLENKTLGHISREREELVRLKEQDSLLILHISRLVAFLYLFGCVRGNVISAI